MFFDMDLLCHQRQGKFGIIWLAATRGITKVERKDVETVNITKICNEILKYVMAHSTSPKKRLSLYLSAKLIYGTVLIYKQQVKYFEQTIITFYCSIRRPLTICYDEAKKRKTTRPKKSKQPEPEQIRDVAEAYGQVLPGINANIIDPIHITLPDPAEGIRRLATEISNLFGDEQQTDQQLANFLGENWMNIPVPVPEKNVVPENIPAPDVVVVPENIPAPDVVVPENVHVPAPGIHIDDILPLPAQDTTTTTPTRQSIAKRLVRSPEGEESPSKRTRTTTVRTVAQVHQPDEPQAPPTSGNGEMPPPRRPPIRPRRRRSNVDRNPISINAETPTRWTRTRFDRPIINLEIENILRSPAQRHAQSGNDAKEIIALILAGVQYDESDMNAIFRDAQAQENTSSESARINLDNNNTELLTTIEPIPVRDNPDIPEIIPNLNSMQIDNVPEPELSPRFSRIMRPGEQIENVSPRLHASTPKITEVTFETAITRQKNLLERIRSLFLENGNAAIQLEQLCDDLIRPKVSTTFGDLLYLHSRQYIRMESVADSIKLGNIYPGVNLLND